MKLAQGILIGSWALAFPFDWARQIVDEFEVSPVPKAAHWLIGSANIDGNIIAVVDLGAYLGNSGASSSRPSRVRLQQRLLIGGLHGQDADQAIGIAFSGLPQQLNYDSQPLTYRSALPERLRELCSGVAKNAAGHDFLEINTEQLMAMLSDELSQV